MGYTTSNRMFQLPGTTANWIVSTIGPRASHQDAIVLKAESISSYTSIERIALQRRGTHTFYRITVRVAPTPRGETGWGAYFRFSAEKMN